MFFFSKQWSVQKRKKWLNVNFFFPSKPGSIPLCKRKERKVNGKKEFQQNEVCKADSLLKPEKDYSNESSSHWENVARVERSRAPVNITAN